jgi:NifU-like protein
VGTYPKKVREILDQLVNSPASTESSADGISAAFECGSSIRFTIDIDEKKALCRVSYETNGCGFMIAAAESLSAAVRGKRLTHLHGTAPLESIIFEALGRLPADRTHCVHVPADAFRRALARYRSKIVEEFQGEKALICTCFGVSEETILEIVERDGVLDVSDVTAACNAGSGCGSCRMLIQELIDGHEAI